MSGVSIRTLQLSVILLLAILGFLIIMGSTESTSMIAKGEEKNGQKPKEYPAHWGEPPRMQTRDLRQLPGGYGMGSGTLARWIRENLDRDAAAAGK